MNDLVSIIFIRVCCNRGARIVCVFTVTNIRIAADEKSKMRSKNVRTGISSRDNYTHGSAAAARDVRRRRRLGSRLFVGTVIGRSGVVGHEAETRVAVPGWRLFVRTCLGRSAGPNGVPAVRRAYIISTYKYTHT